MSMVLGYSLNALIALNTYVCMRVLNVCMFVYKLATLMTNVQFQKCFLNINAYDFNCNS